MCLVVKDSLQRLRLRPLTAADLPFADSIRALAGWNQTLRDWKRFLATEPEGCFLAQWEGQPAGTATTTVYRPELAWIGMVLVHPDYRRRGIGRALLRHCIGYLQQRQVRCIKLDATPAGKLVYDALGFRSEWGLKRWSGSPLALSGTARDQGIRPWNSADVGKVAALDAKVFGVPRQRLLSSLSRQSDRPLVCESSSGEISGFGFAREGAQAKYIGPIGAVSVEAGLGLARELLQAHAGQPVFWDIPDPNECAINLAQEAGLSVQRSLLRMYLGDNVTSGEPRWQFALAGPEVG